MGVHVRSGHRQERPHHRHEGGREGARRRRCGWCCPSCRRPPRTATATSSPCCAASASAACESATAFRDGGRDRARRRRGGRGRDHRRPTCPPSCPTTSCARSSRAAVAETGASAPKDMGTVMKAAMAKVGGRADGKRVSALVQEALRADAPPDRALQRGRGGAGRHAATRSCARSRTTSTATSSCAATSSRSTATPRRSPAAATVVRELAELIEQGHEIGAGHDQRGRPARWTSTQSPAEILEDVVWRHRAPQGRAEDGQPEALRRLDPQQHGHLRHRPGRHRQDLPGRRDGRRRARRGARSTGSSSRARRSRPASGWASCPAT